MFLHACDHFTAMRTNFVDCVGTTTETLRMTSRPQLVNWSKAPMTSATAGTQTQSKALYEAHAVTAKRRVSINSHHRWLTSDSAFRCNKPEVGPSPGCTDAEQELYEGPAYCGIILDNNGPFAACHPKVNPNVSEIEKLIWKALVPNFSHITYLQILTLCVGFLPRLSLWRLWAGWCSFCFVWSNRVIRQWMSGPWSHNWTLEKQHLLSYVWKIHIP